MNHIETICKILDVPQWLIDNLSDLSYFQFISWLSDNLTRLLEINYEFQDMASSLVNYTPVLFDDSLNDADSWLD